MIARAWTPACGVSEPRGGGGGSPDSLRKPAAAWRAFASESPPELAGGGPLALALGV